LNRKDPALQIWLSSLALLSRDRKTGDIIVLRRIIYCGCSRRWSSSTAQDGIFW